MSGNASALSARLSVIPKVGYTQEEINELRRTFSLHDPTGSGSLSARRVQECVRDLSYNYHRDLIDQIIADHIKDKGKAELNFTEFMQFVDVVGAIDGYVVDHIQDLLEGLPEDALQAAYEATGAHNPDELLQISSELVGLRNDDDFDFGDVYRLLGYEDTTPSPSVERTPRIKVVAEESRQTASSVPQLNFSRATETIVAPNFLKVPSVDAETRPSGSDRPSTAARPAAHHISSRSFDAVDGAIDQEPQPEPTESTSPSLFKLPTLIIPTDADVSNGPAPLRTMNAASLDLPLQSEPIQSVPLSTAAAVSSRRSLSPSHKLDNVSRASATSQRVTSDLKSANTAPTDEDFDFDEDDDAYLVSAFKTFLEVFDRDNNGAIGASELAMAMRALGLDPSEAQIDDLFANVDIDRSGLIDLDEFRLYYKRLYAQEFANGISMHQMRAMFERADQDGSGDITREEFRHILRLQCPKLTNKRIQEIVESADRNGDNSIDFDEFLAFVSKPEQTSRLFARKLFRAQIPTPIEHLTAFGRMPSSFRKSALAEWQFAPICRSSTYVAPVLDAASLGLKFGPMGVFPGTNALREIPCELCLHVEVLGAEGIPIPDIHRDRIRARRVRIVMFDGETPASNQYMIRATWIPEEEDRWQFVFPSTNLHNIVLKTGRKQTFLLIEFNLLVTDDIAEGAPRPHRKASVEGSSSYRDEKMVEMTCGFATIDLTAEMASRTTLEKLNVSGGTFRSSSKIKGEDVLARRAGWRKLSQLFKEKPLPSLTLRIGPASSTVRPRQLQESLPWIANGVLISLKTVHVHKMFAEIVADATVRSEQPFQPGFGVLSQDVAIRLYLDSMVNDVDTMSALADRWEEWKKSLNRSSRREVVKGMPSDELKSQFRQCILSFWAVLTSVTLPESNVGITEHERLALLLHCSRSDLRKQLTSDGCSKRINGAPEVDISQSLVYKPFHTDQIDFAYDYYTPERNEFAQVERRILAANAAKGIDAVPAETSEFIIPTTPARRVDRNVSFWTD